MMAIQRKIPYVTSLAAAEATVAGIAEVKGKDLLPKALQDYHQSLKNATQNLDEETKDEKECAVG